MRDADVGMAKHMLYHVPDIAAAIRELRRITKPGGTVLASTNSSGNLAEIVALLDAAVSRQLGRPVQTMPAPSFTTQTGTALLSREFSGVTLRTLDVPLSMPAAQPVITYVACIREPILALVREPLDFDAVLDDIAMEVEQAIQAQGSFRATTHLGRAPRGATSLEPPQCRPTSVKFTSASRLDRAPGWVAEGRQQTTAGISERVTSCSASPTDEQRSSRRGDTRAAKEAPLHRKIVSAVTPGHHMHGLVATAQASGSAPDRRIRTADCYPRRQNCVARPGLAS